MKIGSYLLQGQMEESRTRRLLEILQEAGIPVGYKNADCVTTLIGPNGEEFRGFEDILGTLFPSLTIEALDS